MCFCTRDDRNILLIHWHEENRHYHPDNGVYKNSDDSQEDATDVPTCCQGWGGARWLRPRCPLCPWEKQTGCSTPESVSKTNLLLHTRDRVYLQRGTEPLTGRLSGSSGPNSGSLSLLYFTFVQTSKTRLGCTLKKVHRCSYIAQYSPHQQKTCFC